VESIGGAEGCRETTEICAHFSNAFMAPSVSSTTAVSSGNNGREEGPVIIQWL
jgi:hypothetical protein